MKAWISSSYGKDGNPSDAIDKLEIQEVPIPEPGEGQVLVKISHAAINPIDWKLFSGGFHAIVPCTHPYSPGFDFSGTIVKLGPAAPSSSSDTVDFAVNDVVCGDLGLVETCTSNPPNGGCCGAFAEYCVVPSTIIAKIEDTNAVPGNIACTIPLAGLTALQGLFTRSGRTLAGETLGNLEFNSNGDEKKKKVLVLGGATVVGSYAIQLAKLAGAYVAATASTNLMPDEKTTKLKFCQDKLGADKVLNYKEQSWSEILSGEEYDLIFDTVGSPDDWKNASKVLKESCDFISVANFSPDLDANSKNKFKVYLLKSIGTDLKELVDLFQNGKLFCPIDSIVPFSDVPAAITKNLKSENAGKIVIKVSS